MSNQEKIRAISLYVLDNIEYDISTIHESNNNPLTYLKNKNMINNAKTKNKKKYIIARPKSVINIKYNNKLYNTLNNNNKLDKNVRKFPK